MATHGIVVTLLLYSYSDTSTPIVSYHDVRSGCGAQKECEGCTDGSRGEYLSFWKTTTQPTSAPPPFSSTWNISWQCRWTEWWRHSNSSKLSLPYFRSQANDSSPYDVLDISYLAAEADIKRHYRKKTLLLHPDKWVVKHENVDEVSSLEPHGRKANIQAFDAFNKVSPNHLTHVGAS